MSRSDSATTSRCFRSGAGCLGATVIASGLLAAWLVTGVQKARNAARESQLL
jgi:hypothetical protein